jgi:hypothetical protein
MAKHQHSVGITMIVSCVLVAAAISCAHAATAPNPNHNRCGRLTTSLQAGDQDETDCLVISEHHVNDDISADAVLGVPSVFPASFFGISRHVALPPTKQKPTLVCATNIIPRGGEVLEPESALDVDAVLIRAGSEGKLVVIDFTATW